MARGRRRPNEVAAASIATVNAWRLPALGRGASSSTTTEVSACGAQTCAANGRGNHAAAAARDRPRTSALSRIASRSAANAAASGHPCGAGASASRKTRSSAAMRPRIATTGGRLGARLRRGRWRNAARARATSTNGHARTQGHAQKQTTAIFAHEPVGRSDGADGTVARRPRRPLRWHGCPRSRMASWCD